MTAAVCGALNPEVAVADVAHIALLSEDFEVKLTRDRDASQLRDDDTVIVVLTRASPHRARYRSACACF